MLSSKNGNVLIRASIRGEIFDFEGKGNGLFRELTMPHDHDRDHTLIAEVLRAFDETEQRAAAV